jgi:8-oxo-dGTP pyrophosphatase MutT (NUDIX family)
MTSRTTPRYKTARCILFREDSFLLAIHNRFWPGAKRWGLPGGQIEWGEAPHTAATRELEEELQVYVPELIEIGAYSYKRALHMVYAAPLDQDIVGYDDSELLDIRWFSEADVANLKSRSILHANYELEAIRRLRARLAGDAVAAVG